MTDGGITLSGIGKTRRKAAAALPEPYRFSSASAMSGRFPADPMGSSEPDLGHTVCNVCPEIAALFASMPVRSQ